MSFAKYLRTPPFLGVRKIAPEENCRPIRVRVWIRISVRIRAGGQFSSGAIFLEPFFAGRLRATASDI